MNVSPLFNRDCGILLHPSSLPGDYGVGDFGPAALDWLKTLADAQQNLWQILPLNPAGYGDSPYQGLAAFAANPVFISPEDLHQRQLITAQELESFQLPLEDCIHYAAVYQNKKQMTELAAARFFQTDANSPLRKSYARFFEDAKSWLPDYALFYALKEKHGGVAWTEWPAQFRDRDNDALDKATQTLLEDIQRVYFEQFILIEQWSEVRRCAQEKGIRIIGDLPIFVAHDSVDVWCRPELFKLKPDGRPRVVAGVPPDYFSATGQLWGNPIYDWDAHRAEQFQWWRSRVQHSLNWVDIVRIDHFRGFDACWEVPAEATTAADGTWVPSCGEAILAEMVATFGKPLPLIAEDLGVITDAVIALRDRYELPGIRILQFAFGTDTMKSSFIPDAYDSSCVAYTGTHDNDTTVGWFNSIAGTNSTRSQDEIDREKANACAYFKTDGSQIHLDFINSLYASDAAATLIPLQDLLGLGSEARINVPGQASGSWVWRLPSTDGLDRAMQQLATITLNSERGLTAEKPLSI